MKIVIVVLVCIVAAPVFYYSNKWVIRGSKRRNPPGE
jgi:hypothetical protein